MIPLEKIMEIIYYAIDNGMDRTGISTSINLYSDNVEISFYPMKETGERRENNAAD